MSAVELNSWNVVFFILGDSPASEFYRQSFRNPVSSIFICGVNLHHICRWNWQGEYKIQNQRKVWNHEVLFFPVYDVYLKSWSVVFSRLRRMFEIMKCCFSPSTTYFWNHEVLFFLVYDMYLKSWSVVFPRLRHMFEIMKCCFSPSRTYVVFPVYHLCLKTFVVVNKWRDLLQRAQKRL